MTHLGLVLRLQRTDLRNANRPDVWVSVRARVHACTIQDGGGGSTKRDILWAYLHSFSLYRVCARGRVGE